MQLVQWQYYGLPVVLDRMEQLVCEVRNRHFALEEIPLEDKERYFQTLDDLLFYLESPETERETKLKNCALSIYNAIHELS